MQRRAPRRARLLTREQVQRAYLLAHGEMPPNVPRRPARLDPASDFVLDVGLQQDLKTSGMRQALSRRSPPALVDELSRNFASQRVIKLAPSADGHLVLKADDGPGVSAVFAFKTSENREASEEEGERFPSELRKAAEHDQQALEERWANMARLMLAGATEEERLTAVRPLARRLFSSTRLKPVLAELLGS